MTDHILHWIGGQDTPGTSGRTAPVFNPATGKVTAEADLASAAEVDVAIEIALRAARGWRESSLSSRSAVLFAFRQLLHDRANELAAVVTAEHGKVLSDAYGEVARGGINVPVPVPVASYSFGGWKASMFGDTHMYGPEGASFYTKGKVVTSRWPDPATSTIDMGFPRTR